MALSEPIVRRRDASGQIIWFVAWLSVTGFAMYLRPSAAGHGTHEELGLPPCPSVLLFDRPCPGCGLTTSWTAFIHGDWAMAFHAHPLGPPLYIGFTVVAILGFVEYLRGRRIEVHTEKVNKLVTAFFVCFVAFGLVRMALSPHYGTDQERLIQSALKKQ
ncbi:hypothetical protein BH11ARM1_BH11ARM1_12050 [soil metagenome]